MKRKQPITSHDAYESMKGTPISLHHSKILAALDEIKSGICEDIARHLDMDKAQIYRRMDELEKLGLVREIGTKKTSSGRNAALYELTPPPPTKESIKPNYAIQPSLFP